MGDDLSTVRVLHCQLLCMSRAHTHNKSDYAHKVHTRVNMPLEFIQCLHDCWVQDLAQDVNKVYNIGPAFDPLVRSLWLKLVWHSKILAPGFAAAA